MRKERLKHFFDCYIPIELCNFRCKYCYILQHKLFNNKFNGIDYSPEQLKKAVTKERLGGTCLFNMCGGGETLLMPNLIEYVKVILDNGHYVSIVTNGTCFNVFEDFKKLPLYYRERFFFKFSFHYEQLKERGLFERYFNNIIEMRELGFSFTLELVPYDELIPEIDKIKEISMKYLGAFPHVTVPRREEGGWPILTNLDYDTFYKTWSTFDSDLFEFKYQIFGIKRKEFCYAGIYTGNVIFKNGDIRQCYCGNKIVNIFDKKFKLNKPIGKRCSLPHCYNGHAWLVFGDIPGLKTPTYYDLRNRTSVYGYNWVNDTMKDVFIQKLYDSNGKRKHFTINFLLFVKRAVKLLLRKTKSFIKILFMPIYKSINRKMFNKSIKRYDSYILGVPTHGNLGDIAISIAELKLLEGIGVHPKEITYQEYNKYRKCIIKQCRDKLVFLQGGGNMGDVWPWEEDQRRDILSNVKARHFVLFPQTIFYTDTPSGNAEKEKSIEYYSNRNDLSIFVRERKSYIIAKQLYGNTEIFLVPDIVLYLKGKYSFDTKKDMVLFVLRKDKEKITQEKDFEQIMQSFEKDAIEYSDTVIMKNISLAKREEELIKKLEEFANAKLVVTDRLHGMIFSYLANTPCIAFDNNSHKVSGVYEWIKDNNFISLGNAMSRDVVDRMLSNNVIKSDDKLDFSFLKTEILKYASH